MAEGTMRTLRATAATLNPFVYVKSKKCGLRKGHPPRRLITLTFFLILGEHGPIKHILYLLVLRKNLLALQNKD